MRRFDMNQRGVAMVTVLLIGAALTALTSAAAFVTIEEMGATLADRSAAQALAYAEAGIDRLVLEIRKGNLTWNNISTAGCDSEHPVISYTGTVGAGTYTTTLEVYNRTGPVLSPAERFRPAACSTASQFPQGTHEYLITSTGQQPAAARRVVRQTLDIKPLGLPIGIYAYDRIDANGTVNMENINMISEGAIYNRNNLGFFGTDPYYTLKDFYGPRITDATVGAHKMPGSVHAKGAVYYGPASKLTEHRLPGHEPNCEANDDRGTLDQSMWDTSGTAVLKSLTATCPSWPGSGQDYTRLNPSGNPPYTPDTVTPPTSCDPRECLKFLEEDRKRVAPTPTLSEQDYLTLREAARQNGLFCTGSGVGIAVTLSCTEAGGPPYTLVGGQISTTDIDAITEKSFVVYVEFPNNGIDPFLRDVKWSGGTDIGPCNTNPATNQSAVIVVRRGSFSATGGGKINGAMLIPEGALYTGGGFTMEGTVIARRIESRGTSTLRLSTCWLRNMPGPFLDPTKVTWSEVDR